MFHPLTGTPDDRTIAMLRLVLGIVFFAHGGQKMLGWFGSPYTTGSNVLCRASYSIPQLNFRSGVTSTIAESRSSRGALRSYWEYLA
jgi:uncharacterized membrane protein YphA (DoxX/SURF4 family)